MLSFLELNLQVMIYMLLSRTTLPILRVAGHGLPFNRQSPHGLRRVALPSKREMSRQNPCLTDDPLHHSFSTGLAISSLDPLPGLEPSTILLTLSSHLFGGGPYHLCRKVSPGHNKTLLRLPGT